MPPERTFSLESSRGTTLDDRVITTLSKMPGRLSFSGLRRALRAHPESLARALRRLEREGVVEHAEGGYRLLTLPREPTGAKGRAPELRVLADLRLPDEAPLETVARRLEGRWFGSLRWVGRLSRDGETQLAWSRRDGAGQLLLGLRPGRLRILCPVSENDGIDASETEEAGYELLFHVLEHLRTPANPRGSSALFFAMPTGGSEEGAG
jgi:hypothetical protein